LSEPPTGPPISCICFVSDAAGAALRWENGKCKNDSVPGDRGVVSVGFEEEFIFFVSGLRWPFTLITRSKDCNGRLFGGKSTALECVGLLLPFITRPDLVKNRYVRLFVDNLNLIYGWDKRYSRSDSETSLLLRVLHVLEAYLECKIFVEHVKRMSNPMASLADRLTRKSSTKNSDLDKVDHVQWEIPPPALMTWLENPVLDWNLPNKFVSEIQKLK
jgi:hypothetical protein